MVARLIRPDNKQPAEYVTYTRGYVCLRLLDTISPAVRWFSNADMFAVNPMHTCAMPPRAIVLYVTPDMVSTSKSTPGINVKQSSGVEIVVRPAA